MVEERVNTLVLFGAFGDLARRKLYLALYHLHRRNCCEQPLRILALGRREVSTEQFRQHIGEALTKALHKSAAASSATSATTANTPSDSDVPQAEMTAFLAHIDYLCLDLHDRAAFSGIANWRGAQAAGSSIFYFATAAPLYSPSLEGLAAAELIRKGDRVVVEKPIGYDLASSREINDLLAHYFAEDDIYRIDHYLGKETVQNLLALRFANALFESQWDQSKVSHVEISIAETVGIEGRWDYFDQAGQMRDMLQSHLLQLLCLVAMDPPHNLGADAIRDEKLKVLRALRHFDASARDTQVVRGQYVNGRIDGEAVPGYLEEEGANPGSETGTFFAARVDIDNWRWSGVPFYIRTGKRMPEKVTQIVLHFKPTAHFVFDDDQRDLAQNKLIIRIQPDEGISLQILNKQSGLEQQRMRLRRLPLNLSFVSKGERFPDAYERLIWEVVRGDQYLFVRRDEVEAAWEWCDHVMQLWQAGVDQPAAYAAGTWGPEASFALIKREGHRWHEDTP